VLAPGLDALRLSLHVLAATIWVGGQFVLAGLVAPARQLGDNAPRRLARAFARMAWPAYVVLVGTGFWNLSTVTWSAQSVAWRAVLITKLVLVGLSGLSALLHGRAGSKAAIALWGAVGGLSSAAALVMGVLLAG
jgi:uncharacterized membrane protein